MSGRRIILLAAHGAGDSSDANRAMRRIAAALGARRPELRVATGFQLGTPRVDEVRHTLGNGPVTVIPVLAARGWFATERLPAALGAPGDPRVVIARPVGTLRRAQRRIVERAAALVDELPAPMTVVVVGHGTTRHRESGSSTRELAAALGARLGARMGLRIEVAFLDEAPRLEQVAAAHREGTLVIVPQLLGGGEHEREDLARRTACVAGGHQARAGGRRVHILPALGADDALLDDVLALVDQHDPDRVYRLGTRTSPLALVQARLVAEALESHGVRCTIVPISTLGDRAVSTPIEAFATSGPFTDDIERALACDEIDLAVHSVKDLPLGDSEETAVAGVLRRGSAEEVLVTRDGRTLAELPAGARIGTSSRRRVAQLLALRPDLHPVPMRGAVDARLADVERGVVDGAILAAAGIERLGAAERIVERFSIERFVPEAGQGALAITTRVDDEPAQCVARKVEHAATRCAVEIERAIARALEARSIIAAAHVASGETSGETSGESSRPCHVTARIVNPSGSAGTVLTLTARSAEDAVAMTVERLLSRAEVAA